MLRDPAPLRRSPPSRSRRPTRCCRRQRQCDGSHRVAPVALRPQPPLPRVRLTLRAFGRLRPPQRSSLAVGAAEVEDRVAQLEPVRLPQRAERRLRPRLRGSLAGEGAVAPEVEEAAGRPTHRERTRPRLSVGCWCRSWPRRQVFLAQWTRPQRGRTGLRSRRGRPRSRNWLLTCPPWHMSGSRGAMAPHTSQLARKSGHKMRRRWRRFTPAFLQRWPPSWRRSATEGSGKAPDGRVSERSWSGRRLGC